MIEITGLKKSFGQIQALENVSLKVCDGEVFGLVGTNGAGKSTLLRIIAGILKQDGGSVTIDGEPVYDNPAAKEKFFFIPDELYFFPNSTPAEMKRYFERMYPSFSSGRFSRLMKDFGLEEERKIQTFSKGMKKQLSILFGVSAGTKYLLLDETFDGLDPVMRQGMKSLFAGEMEDRGMTPLLTSHNLRELEDICDHMGLLHQGGVLLSQDIQTMKLSIQKVQCAFAEGVDAAEAVKGIDILTHETRGRLHTLTLRGTQEEVVRHFTQYPTVFFEILTPSLEEIFISETEVMGYDFRKLLLE